LNLKAATTRLFIVSPRMCVRLCRLCQWANVFPLPSFHCQPIGGTTPSLQSTAEGNAVAGHHSYDCIAIVATTNQNQIGSQCGLVIAANAATETNSCSCGLSESNSLPCGHRLKVTANDSNSFSCGLLRCHQIEFVLLWSLGLVVDTYAATEIEFVFVKSQSRRCRLRYHRIIEFVLLQSRSPAVSVSLSPPMLPPKSNLFSCTGWLLLP